MLIPLYVYVLGAVGLVALWATQFERGRKKPLSVNYHFTRKCNFACGFCFHTAQPDKLKNLSLEETKVGFRLLKEAGTRKINFSGGEPFLIERGEHLGKMVQFCKEELGFESISIISNGSLIKRDWFLKYGKYVDILAISCDSFSSETNEQIGRRGSKEQDHREQLRQIKQWCDEFQVMFKINTVVNSFNVDEDMTEGIKELNPVRWKVFQCLELEGENKGEGTLRDASQFTITRSQFQSFLERHSSIGCLVAEDNETMKDSYLILDEEMRFLDCTQGTKAPTRASILRIGVQEALKSAGFDSQAFIRRRGIYAWSRTPSLDLSW